MCVVKTYHQEIHREITRIYNKDDMSMDTLLTGVMKTLYSDMSTFIKTTHLPRLVADNVSVEVGETPMIMDNDYVKCEKMKKQCEQLRVENTTRGKVITTLESEFGRLKNGGLVR